MTEQEYVKIVESAKARGQTASLVDADEIVRRQLRRILGAAAKLGVPTEDLSNRLTTVRSFPNPQVNASTSSTDDWRTVTIGVNLGLMLFFHKMIKVFISRFGVIDQDSSRQESSIALGRTAAMGQRLMKAFWDGTLINEPGFPLEEFSKEQFLLGMNCLDAAETFVIGHELGHAVINCFPGTLSHVPIGQSLAESAIDTGPISVPIEHRARLIREWGEEFSADYFGLAVTVSSCANPVQKEITLWAIEMALVQMDMLEQFYRQRTGQRPPLGSHPPSKVRRIALRAALGKNTPKGILAMMDGIVDIGHQILTTG